MCIFFYLPCEVLNEHIIIVFTQIFILPIDFNPNKGLVPDLAGKAARVVPIVKGLNLCAKLRR